MEQATRIVAIRHGETDWNAAQRVQGQLDIELNARGLQQARRLCAQLAGETFDAVYCSDLRRARATAEAFAVPAGLALRLEPGLRERAFGFFEGHTFTDIEQRWPDLAQRWRLRDVDFAPEGGETLREFQARAVRTAQRLAEAHRGQSIALVAHGGVMDALYRAAARIDLRAPRTWALANAAVNRLLYTDSGFAIVGWGDTGEL